MQIRSDAPVRAIRMTSRIRGPHALPEGSARTWVMLGLAAVLPLLLFGGWVAIYSAQQMREDTHRTAFDKVQRLSVRIADELSAQLQVAEALAASSALDHDDLQAFRQEAVRLQALQPLWYTIELTAPSGAQVLNLLREDGDHLGSTVDLDSFHKVLATHRPAVGGIGPVGPLSGRRLVTLRVPVLRAGVLRYVLSFAMAPDSIATLLKTAGAPSDWIGVVIDSSGHIITRTAAESRHTGGLASPTLRQAAARAPTGDKPGSTLEGVGVSTVYSRLPATADWTVAFGIPTELLEGPVRQSLYILAGAGGVGLALAACLTSLVAHDLAQRRRDERDRAARALSVSEERQSLAMEAAELGSWRWEVEPDRFEASERCRNLLDLPPRPPDGIVERWSEVAASVYPDDRRALERGIRQCLEDHEPLCSEFRIVRQDGSLSWLRADGRLREGAAGQLRILNGVLADISARKRAEEDRLALLRRLAQAQEEERRRISRELHDQVGQTVTGLSLGLKTLADAMDTPADDDLQERLRWLQSLTAEINHDIHRAASDLRPAVLDDFGLHRAVETFAAGWSERYGVNTDVQAVGSRDRLPCEIETVLYRVIQEALTNVLKHAAARNVSLLLERRDAQFRIVIEDDGSGFDPNRVDHEVSSPRLGLSGVRERLSLVGGCLLVESTPGAGTTLFAQVPLETRKQEASARQ